MNVGAEAAASHGCWKFLSCEDGCLLGGSTG